MTEPRRPNDPPNSDDPARVAPTTGGVSDVLLSVRGLRVHFPVRSGILQRTTGFVRAVDGVSFDLPRGRSLGVVGESGSGKTTLGRAVLNLIPRTSGTILFDGQPLEGRSGPEAKAFRRDMQIIFQDPAGALNPRLRVGEIIAEPIRVHKTVSADQTESRVREVLTSCGLKGSAANRYPHEFSGGQRQRIVIARALASNPRFIVCDEPTSALDVSIQGQIVNLLRRLQADLGLTYLFISHDMAVVRHMCDDIAVMRAGQIVEQGPRDRVLNAPEHEYTRSLLAAVPRISEHRRRVV